MKNRPQHLTLVSASLSAQSGATVSDVLSSEHIDATGNPGHTNSAHAEFEALLARAWRVQQGRAALHNAAAWRSGHGSRKRAASRGNS